MLSKYCSNIANEFSLKIGGVTKLVQNSGSKIRYIFFVIETFSCIYH